LLTHHAQPENSKTSYAKEAGELTKTVAKRNGGRIQKPRTAKTKLKPAAAVSLSEVAAWVVQVVVEVEQEAQDLWEREKQGGQ